MTSSPDEWRRAAPAARLSRPSISSWTGRSYTSQQLIDGLRKTAATRSAQLEMQSRAWLRLHKARLGLFFRVITSAQIAGAAVFLASEHARSINGDTIAIDGGSLTRGYPALLTGVKKAA